MGCHADKLLEYAAHDVACRGEQAVHESGALSLKQRHRGH